MWRAGTASARPPGPSCGCRRGNRRRCPEWQRNRRNRPTAVRGWAVGRYRPSRLGRSRRWPRGLTPRALYRPAPATRGDSRDRSVPATPRHRGRPTGRPSGCLRREGARLAIPKRPHGLRRPPADLSSPPAGFPPPDACGRCPSGRRAIAPCSRRHSARPTRLGDRDRRGRPPHYRRAAAQRREPRRWPRSDVVAPHATRRYLCAPAAPIAAVDPQWRDSLGCHPDGLILPRSTAAYPRIAVNPGPIGTSRPKHPASRGGRSRGITPGHNRGEKVSLFGATFGDQSGIWSRTEAFLCDRGGDDGAVARTEPSRISAKPAPVARVNASFRTTTPSSTATAGLT